MKKVIHKVKSVRFLRFASVGVINTLLDFTILNVIVKLFNITSLNKKGVVAASIISGTTVSLVSFYLNRKYVFKVSGSKKIQYFKLLVVSLSGVYLIQASIISLTLSHVGGLANFAHSIAELIRLGNIFDQDFMRVNIAKVFGTAGIMIWNYTLYRKFVFKEKT
jgi:putative flippase GtrA